MTATGKIIINIYIDIYLYCNMYSNVIAWHLFLYTQSESANVGTGFSPKVQRIFIYILFILSRRNA